MKATRRARAARALLVVVVAAVAMALAPARVEAQARTPKQRTRITAADRKAAADARKAKMAEWKRSRGATPASPPAGRGGAR
jgi:hypothetical protein